MEPAWAEPAVNESVEATIVVARIDFRFLIFMTHSANK
jgi:hypothetical protein